jgi:hypothetical protein
MSDKKKRDFGDPIFHCFVALSVADTIAHIRNVEQYPHVNYVPINGNSEFHYFLLQNLELYNVTGRILGALNRWAQSDETSVGIFAFDSHLYDRMFSVSLFSDEPTFYDIEAYHRMSRSHRVVEVPHTLSDAESRLLECIQKVLPEAE